MKVVRLVALTLALVVVGAAIVHAQPPAGPGRFGAPGMGPGGFGAGMGMLGLLRLEQVRDELGITEEQQAKLQELGRQLMESGRERFQGLRDLPEEQRRARLQELMEQARAEMEEQIGKVLTADQMKRLRQIALQQELQAPGGVRALARKDVAAALGLTEEQVRKINALADSIQEQMRGMFRPGAGPEEREQLRQKMEELRANARKEVEQILTQEQLGKLKELLGAPFRIEMGPGFGPPRGEGAPRGPQRGPGGPGGAAGERGGRGARGGARGGNI